MFQQNNLVQAKRRSVPYPSSGQPIFLPQYIWEETLSSLSKYRAKKSECLVFWGGIVGASGEVVITSLLRPNHTYQGWRVQLTSSEMKNLLRALRNRDEKLMVQIHSHPGEAFHSPGDDDLATSFHNGFLSIVVPNFAKNISSISQCAVYEYSEVKFARLTSEQVEHRFVIYNQVVDLAASLQVKRRGFRRRRDGTN